MRHFLDHHQGSFFPLFKLWYKCTGLDTPAVQWRVRDWSRKDHILCEHSSFTRTATLLEAENDFVITNPQPSTGCTVLVWKAVMESLEKYWVPRNKTPTRGGGEGGVTAPWLRYIWPTLESFVIFLYRTSHKQTQYYVGHVLTMAE